MHVPSTSSAKVTRKGQATIPKAIRDHLKLRPGDRIAFVIDENGRVVLLPIVLDAVDLPGILAPPRRVVPLDEMEAVIRYRRRLR